MDQTFTYFIITISLGFFAWLIFQLLFGKGSRGQVPSLEKVRNSVKNMDDETINIIKDLHSQYESHLVINVFSELSIATALAIEQSVEELTNRIVLRAHFDSLSTVEFIILIEQLYNIEILDEDASNILTFEDLFHYVETTFANNKQVVSTTNCDL